MNEASGLINGLRTLDVPGVEIRFAGLDARNLQPATYNDYIIPWNSLYNRHEHGFDVGETMTRGTENFIRDVSGYLDTLPVGTGFIFIGHSFGGDSVLSLLQAVRQTRRPVLFAGVIDPVDGGGIRNTMRIKDVGSTVQYFFNRWQTNQLWPFDFVSSGSIQCSAKQCDQDENNHHRNYDGSHERVRCGDLELGCSGAGEKWEMRCTGPRWARVCGDVPVGYDPGTKRKPVSHSSLPVDAYIQRQMFEAISAQISEFAQKSETNSNLPDVKATQLPGSSWIGQVALTALGSSLYAVENGKLWRVNPVDGKATQLPGSSWIGQVALTALGSSLYAIENGTLWRVNPADGKATQLPGSSWIGQVALTALGSSLYAIENGKLWRVNPADGKATQLPGSSWIGQVALTALGSSLYAIENEKLWRVNPADGKATQLPGSSWIGQVALTALGDGLYAIENEKLWRVKP